MTDKELRKLKRSELMEILYYLQKEVETLQKENESLKQQLGNAQGGISSENLEKIIEAVRSAAGEAFRGQSEGKSTEVNDGNDESGKETPDDSPEAGKREDG